VETALSPHTSGRFEISRIWRGGIVSQFVQQANALNEHIDDLALTDTDFRGITSRLATIRPEPHHYTPLASSLTPTIEPSQTFQHSLCFAETEFEQLD
jgi:hypothetical protein